MVKLVRVLFLQIIICIFCVFLKHKERFPIAAMRQIGNLNAHYRAAFAFSQRVANAALSATAISASILRLRSMPATLRPCIRVE